MGGVCIEMTYKSRSGSHASSANQHLGQGHGELGEGSPGTFSGARPADRVRWK